MLGVCGRSTVSFGTAEGSLSLAPASKRFRLSFKERSRGKGRGRRQGDAGWGSQMVRVKFLSVSLS